MVLVLAICVGVSPSVERWRGGALLLLLLFSLWCRVLLLLLLSQLSSSSLAAWRPLGLESASCSGRAHSGCGGGSGESGGRPCMR